MEALTLDRAQTIIQTALKKGRELELAPLAVAVLDAGGHLKTFAREDGAGILRPKIATGKAWGALGRNGRARTPRKGDSGRLLEFVHRAFRSDTVSRMRSEALPLRSVVDVVVVVVREDRAD